ncbi:GntR family transcriptional regulator (plasmid) [Streptomyces sp. FR-008]|nr:GntR family transcriptional regulator [Streptomyces sp. FR-008]
MPRAGVGTVVAGPISNNISARVQLHATTGRALGGGEVSRIVAVGTVGADELVAPRLDVAPGTPVHMRQRIVSRGDVPVHLSTSYYPAYVIAAVPELTQPTSTGGSRELAAERLGSAQDHVLEEVTSRHATEAERASLGLTAEEYVPVSQVVRTVVLADGRVVEVAVKVTGGRTVLRWSTSLK